MTFNEMYEKGYLGIAALLFIVSIGSNVYFYQQNAKLEKDLSESQSKNIKLVAQKESIEKDLSKQKDLTNSTAGISLFVAKEMDKLDAVFLDYDKNAVDLAKFIQTDCLSYNPEASNRTFSFITGNLKDLQNQYLQIKQEMNSLFSNNDTKQL